MKFSIRIRLTLLIGSVFLFVLILLLASGGLALYLKSNEELDLVLGVEERFLSEMLEADFGDLLTSPAEAQKALEQDLAEELNEIVGFRPQFVIVMLGPRQAKVVYTNSRDKDVLSELPKEFLSHREGIYNHHYDDRTYRILVSKQAWGTLAIGLENRIFYEVMEGVWEILAVGAPVTLLIVLVGGWLLARLVMKPVVSTANIAAKITLTNLEKRLPEYKGGDEFGILVSTLNNLIARIEEGVKQIRQFTQDAAHELRTPLTIQRGELELLYEQENLPEEVHSAVQKSLDRAISMNKIIENLMLLSQSDANNYPIRKRKFRLDEVLSETVEDAQNLSEKKNVNIALKKDDPVEFLGDEHLIRRLLLNITDNALKYTREGEIEFALESYPDEIQLTIRDTGIGIPEEDLPQIFDRFYRVDKSRNVAIKGSGLGLAISKWIVEAHNGEISIESTPGKGTLVRIRFFNSPSTKS
jgi:signal transduction histidine kinase